MRLKTSSLSYGIYNEVKKFKVKSVNYVTDEVAEYMLNDENITEDLIDAGYSVGVHKLSPKHFREFSKDLAEERAKESKMIAIVVQLFPLGSKLELVSRKHQESGCMEDLMRAISDHYRSNSLSTCLKVAQKYVEIMSTKEMSYEDSSNKLSAIIKLYEEVVGLSTGDSDMVKQRAYKLWEFFIRIAYLQRSVSHDKRIGEFIQRFIVQDMTRPTELDIEAKLDSLNKFMQSTAEVETISPVKGKDTVGVNALLIDGKEIKLSKKRVQVVVNALNAGSASGSGPGPSGRASGQKRAKRHCSHCDKDGHSWDWCWHNPSCDKRARRPSGFVAKSREALAAERAAVHVSMVNIQTSSGISASELEQFDGGNTDPIKVIIIDGGSTHNCINFHYRFLFLTYMSIEPLYITGIGGVIEAKIIGMGTISFMGVVMEAYYAPRIHKSVVGEGYICERYGFTVCKHGSKCIVSVSDSNFSIDLVDGQYPLKLSMFQCHQLNPNATISLASVRPASAKTLWHGRFGHFNMRTIIRMAKSDLYKDRGLKLPDNLLKHDAEEDLCECCAIGKPTLSTSHLRHKRSDIKGKLWYTDVSGGGNRVPSLFSGNTYMWIFVDSCTRMYFTYYTKAKDEATTIKILKEHMSNAAFMTLKENDDVIFFQSDNGEMDTKGVRSYLMRSGAIQRFTNPYHPEMNGMAERAFRTINELSTSMMVHAGLPDPYWEEATRYAALITNIVPNQTDSGWAREAYYLWTGLIFDYSLLRTWGSRAYAINHIQNNDYVGKSEEGIYVGFKKKELVTRCYRLYLPHKNRFVETGDVIMCEHVGRREPERLLPPVLMIPKSRENLDVKDYQSLVGTIHYDNTEGIQYEVVRVYVNSDRLNCVDRVIHINDGQASSSKRKLDTVHLLDVLGYPIIQGPPNASYAPGRIVYPTKVSQAEEGIEMNQELPNQDVSHQRDSLGLQPVVSPLHEKEDDAHSERVAHRKRSAGKEQSLSGLNNSKRRSARLSINALEVEEDDYNELVTDLYTELSLGVEQPSIFTTKVQVSSIGEQPTAEDNYIEPKTHDDVMRSDQMDEWIASEAREIGSLERSKFAAIVDIPKGRKILRCRWVYTFKRTKSGKIMVFKSRVVIRGDQAIKGIDFFETFSPVAKMETIRIAIALIILLRLKPLQLDVNTAFLHAELDEDIYMFAIPGYPLPSGKCYKLLKSLYGLPQAGRNWNKKFESFLLGLGFFNLREDLCLFILVRDGVIIVIFAMYVDDFLLGTDSDETEEWLLKCIMEDYDIKIIGLPTLLVGISLEWTPMERERYYEKVHLSIPKSINSLTKLLDISDDTKSRKVPVNPSFKFSKSDCPDGDLDEATKRMQKWYQAIVGTTIWINTTVRIDISFGVHQLCQFMSNPGYAHYDAAIWMARYLKGTINRGIEYSMHGDFNITGYVDSDHASAENRKSCYHFLFMFAGAPIYWKSGTSDRVCIGGTAESEVRGVHAMKKAFMHNIYLKKVFSQIGLNDIAARTVMKMSEVPMWVYEDNNACIRYSENEVSASKMKHLETDIYWIQESVQKHEELKLVKISTENQIADMGTKALEYIPFESNVSVLMKDRGIREK